MEREKKYEYLKTLNLVTIMIKFKLLNLDWLDLLKFRVSGSWTIYFSGTLLGPMSVTPRTLGANPKAPSYNAQKDPRIHFSFLNFGTKIDFFHII